MTPLDILEQQAVDSAVNSNWANAISLNKKIIESDPTNIGAYLRLGFANLQMNDIPEAKKYYEEALKVQPKNNIALEHLEKISVLKSKGKSASSTANLDPNLFLELPGKTKTVKLVNIGQKEDLAGLSIGQEVELKEKKRRLEARTKEGDYIGCLPDDVSKRLMFFLADNSEYKTYIKETSLNEVMMFIKEVSKGPKVNHYASFPSNPQVYLSDINQDNAEDGEEGEDDDTEDGHSEWDHLEHDDSHEDKEDVDSVIQVEDEDEELDE